jgi:hypothetical protein
MMTENQLRRFYFRAWAACSRALGWNRAPVRLASHGAPEVNSLYQAVWTAAEALARQPGGSVTANDLRHACHHIALGADKSAKTLTNAEADRVVALFNLLAAPEDFDAMMAWQNPEAGAVKRLTWAIEHLAPAAYVEAVASDKFGTRAWQTLPEASLRQLALTLRNRKPGGGG